jgi:hypothetical protein
VVTTHTICNTCTGTHEGIRLEDRLFEPSINTTTINAWDLQPFGSAAFAIRRPGENPLFTLSSAGLDVAGAVNASQYKLNGVLLAQWQSSGNDIFYNTGNVGIGTSAPLEKLSVNGNIRIGPDPAIFPAKSYYLIVGEKGIDSYFTSGQSTALYLNYNTQQSVSVGNPLVAGDANLAVAGVTYTRKIIIGDGHSPFTGPHTDFLLAVNGKMVAKSAYVTLSGWGDFVFDKKYARMSWKEKKDFFDKYMHMPNMLSANEIETNGLDMGEALKGVTINVEENSLDIVALYQRLEKLEKENEQLKVQIISIKKQK